VDGNGQCTVIYVKIKNYLQLEYSKKYDILGREINNGEMFFNNIVIY
jgi:hypothetical protein